MPTKLVVDCSTGAVEEIELTAEEVAQMEADAAAAAEAGASGVTINGTGTKTRAQWSAASLLKTATDTWTLIGDITT